MCVAQGYIAHTKYRGTSLIRKSPLPPGHHRALGIFTMGFAVFSERGTPVGFGVQGPGGGDSWEGSPCS